MDSLREISQKIIRDYDSESSFTILLSAAMIPHLEEPLNRARFFDYDKKLELYFDSKDINRFSRVKELTSNIAKRIKSKEVKGFERILKLFRENGVMEREKEGPSDGMAWKGFGGVHSHYNLTPLGKALLVFQTSLRCSAVDFRKIATFEHWDDLLETELNAIITSVANKTLKIRDRENHFYAKRLETSIITQLIFEFIAGTSKKVTDEQIQKYIWDKAGEIHIGEIPFALERLKALLTITGNSYILNTRGRNARIGYANVLVETALVQDDSEIVQYMITADNLEQGAINLLQQYALWF
ncbi:MAG: hypothetical protein FK730_09805 [Asgard group archaeon]|nr:hypothetical protein [Asgard group archaeon]